MDYAGGDAPDQVLVIGMTARPVQVVLPAIPAAGADWSYVFTRPGRVWVAYGKLVASATVANRDPQFTITSPDGQVVCSIPVSADQTAGQTVQWNWFSSAALQNKSSHQCIPIPFLTLGIGWKVGPITTGIDVADQWSIPALTVEFLD